MKILLNIVCSLAGVLLLTTFVQSQQSPVQKRYKLKYTPFDSSGMPLLHVKMPTNQDAIFAVDTGTGFSCVTEAAIARLSLKQQPLADEAGHPFSFGNIDNMVLTTVTIGELPIPSPLLVVNVDKLFSSRKLTVDGLIGTSVLENFAVLLDFQKQEITLYFPGDLNEAERKEAGFENVAALPKADNGKISFYVSVRLNDKVTTDLVIDTGSVGTYLPADVAKQLQLQAKSRYTGQTFFGNQKRKMAFLERLALGPITLWNLPVSYADKDLPNFPPHIGMDVLSHCRVLIDYPARKLYLKPVDASPSAPTSNPDIKMDKKP